MKPLYLNRPPGATYPTRQLGLPTMQSAPPSMGFGLAEDFFTVTTLPASVFATSADGNPAWLFTNISGSGVAGGSDRSEGHLQVQCGSAANSIIVCEQTNKSRTTGMLGANPSLGTLVGWTLQLRFHPSATLTNMNYGVALLNGTVAYGTDWLSDPVTTLLGYGGVCFVRHAASYASGTAGAMYMRYVDASGVDDFSVLLDSAPVGGVGHKYEMNFVASSKVLTTYYDGVVKDTRTLGATPLGGHRVCVAAGNGASAAARQCSLDCIQYEVEVSVAR